MDSVEMNSSDNLVNNNIHRIKPKRGKKLLIIIIFVLVLALILVGIRKNVGGMTSKYIEPIIKDVPVVKHLLPEVSDDPYENYSREQLINMVDGSQVQEETLNLELEDKEIMIEELNEQIQNLKVFEEEHLAFKEAKRDFDRQVATQDENEFIQFYENMYPEYANEIYMDLIQTQHMNKEQKRYASMISEMDASSAARVLENLFQTDMDIILSILSNMEMENAASILEEMDSKIASTVVKQLSPE